MEPIRHHQTRHLPFLSVLVIATFAGVVALATMIATQGGGCHELEQRRYDLMPGGLPAIQGTFRTENLVVDNASQLGSATATTLTIDTNGQSVPFSTFAGSNSDGRNIWIGGGGSASVGSIGDTTLGSKNVSLGPSALANLTTSQSSIGIGPNALENLTSGANNIGIGDSSLHSVQVTGNNIGIGVASLLTCVTGHDNIGIGTNALQVSPSNDNLAIGTNALGQASNTGGLNTALGVDALLVNTTGIASIAIGVTTLLNNQSGSQNIGIGNSDLESNVDGSNNIAIGVGVMEVLVHGTSNVAIGTVALLNALGSHNTVVGDGGLTLLVSGDHNTAIGDETGQGILNGSGNTIIGAQISGLGSGTTDAIILSDGEGAPGQQIWFSDLAPASVNHGALGAGSENTQGNVTGVGATSVVLTFGGAPFPNHAWCHAQLNSDVIAGQYIRVTNSNTAPTFSCFLAGAASNCNDFSYWCTGQ